MWERLIIYRKPGPLPVLGWPGSQRRRERKEGEEDDCSPTPSPKPTGSLKGNFRNTREESKEGDKISWSYILVGSSREKQKVSSALAHGLRSTVSAKISYVTQASGSGALHEMSDFLLQTTRGRRRDFHPHSEGLPLNIHGITTETPGGRWLSPPLKESRCVEGNCIVPGDCSWCFQRHSHSWRFEYPQWWHIVPVGRTVSIFWKSSLVNKLNVLNCPCEGETAKPIFLYGP